MGKMSLEDYKLNELKRSCVNQLKNYGSERVMLTDDECKLILKLIKEKEENETKED